MKNAVAVVMAGGKSSRMQRDKALLPFGESPSLAEFQVRRLLKLFSKVYLSAKSNKFDFEVEVIEDLYENASPLVALVSVFETLEEEELFVLSVDAPFVSETIIKKLYEEAEAHSDVDIVIAKSSRGIEPLCAIYRRSFSIEAHKALKKNHHRLQALLASLKVIEVMVEEEEAFLNLNHPHEYEEAKARLEHLG